MAWHARGGGGVMQEQEALQDCPDGQGKFLLQQLWPAIASVATIIDNTKIPTNASIFFIFLIPL